MFKLSPMLTVNLCPHQLTTGNLLDSGTWFKKMFEIGYGNSWEKIIHDWGFILWQRGNTERKWHFKPSMNKWYPLYFVIVPTPGPLWRAFCTTLPTPAPTSSPLTWRWSCTGWTWRCMPTGEALWHTRLISVEYDSHTYDNCWHSQGAAQILQV